MKIRISHFDTKNIALTNFTRPTPTPLYTTAAVDKKAQTKGADRNRLAQRIGLPAIFCGWRQGSGNQNKNNKKANILTKARKTPTKVKRELNLFDKESKYAARPVRPKSKILEAVIEQEIRLFRNGGRTR